MLWRAVVEWVGFYFPHLLATFQFLQSPSVPRGVVDVARRKGNFRWPQTWINIFHPHLISETKMDIYFSSLKKRKNFDKYPILICYFFENSSKVWDGECGKKIRFIIEKLVYTVRKVIMPE